MSVEIWLDDTHGYEIASQGGWQEIIDGLSRQFGNTAMPNIYAILMEQGQDYPPERLPGLRGELRRVLKEGRLPPEALEVLQGLSDWLEEQK